jgi:cytochrome c-type protein NapC
MNPKFQKPRARKQHLNAFEQGQTCIDCHKGIAHKEVRSLLSDEEIEALEAPNPDFIRPVPELFKKGLLEIEAIEAAQAKVVAKEKQLVKEEKKAAKQAEDERVKKAVEDALSKNTKPSTLAQGLIAPVSADESDHSVAWADISSREVTVFYPGQTSLEWILNGRDHGGARAFLKSGDRCVSCHDKETASMGDRIVKGEKAEPTPIPGKRGSIAVDVKASFDDENLYLRFEWEKTAHSPVPFVEGGKMDPENEMKLAVMFATDELEFADRAGCWATCHHDTRTMPDTPDSEAVATNPAAKMLDISNGITKYVKESRSKIEIKGRRGKKRGGWDKLKTPEEIKSAESSSAIMDLIRYSSGSGHTEDGSIYSQRTMQGGQGFDVKVVDQKGNWVIEFKRKLKSDKAGDISLDTSKIYNFGFAIHDDYTNARFHHVSLGYRLGFDNAEADINAERQ